MNVIRRAPKRVELRVTTQGSGQLHRLLCVCVSHETCCPRSADSRETERKKHRYSQKWSEGKNSSNNCCRCTFVLPVMCASNAMQSVSLLRRVLATSPRAGGETEAAGLARSGGWTAARLSSLVITAGLGAVHVMPKVRYSGYRWKRRTTREETLEVQYR